MLKTTPSASTRLDYTMPNENEFDTDGSSGGSGKDIKNLSIIEKLAKSKKLDFLIVKSSKADFLTSEVRKVFIHLQKAFTKTGIFRYFDPKYYI